MRDERESWTQNGRREGNTTSNRSRVAEISQYVGRTYSGHRRPLHNVIPLPYIQRETHIHTTEKLTIATTNDTSVHQPLYLQQSGGVW